MVVLKQPRYRPIGANTALQAANATSAALCITDRAGVQPSQQRKPALADFVLQPYRRM